MGAMTAPPTAPFSNHPNGGPAANFPVLGDLHAAFGREDPQERLARCRAALAAGAPINAPTPLPFFGNDTPLIQAVLLEDWEVMGILLAFGADPNGRSVSEGTPLMAVARGRATTLRQAVRVVRALTKAGADPHASDRAGDTPLICAARHGNIAAARALLRVGANPNADRSMAFGTTALIAATVGGHLTMAHLLVQAGANPNTVGNGPPSWRTALTAAIINGHTDIATLLLDAGADPNAASEEGVTPLIQAALHNRTDIVTMLVERGADPLHATHAGNTAEDIARAHEHTAVVDRLRPYREHRELRAAAQPSAHQGVPPTTPPSKLPRRM